MRRLAVLVAAATLVLAAASADAASPGFRYGVAAGEITSTSAVLWTRAPRPGAVLLTVSTSTSVPVGRFAAEAHERQRPDGAARRPRAEGRHELPLLLHPGQGEERDRFVHDRACGRSVRLRSVRDLGRRGCDAGSNGKPAFNRYEVYQRMRAEANHFNINLGDTIYSDSEVAGTPVARTVPAKWAKYRLGLALPALWALRASAGLYSHWDDHEFINDFSRPEHGEAIYAAGVKAFRDYSPVTYSLGDRASTGRSAGGSTSSSSSSTSARSAARRRRSAAAATSRRPRPRPCATRSPRSRQDSAIPVPPACLAAIDDPARTMLGARQCVEFTTAIRSSTATWKVIVNEVPIQQYYALPYDRWEGYAAEREQLLRFLRRT